MVIIMPYTFTTHNDNDNINVNMSHLQGYIEVPKSELVRVLGKPLEYGDDKIINEWFLEVADENGEAGVITIYDWKNYDMAELPDDYARWNVGGFVNACPRVLHELLAQLGVKSNYSKTMY
jgi:hypothetical protein